MQAKSQEHRGDILRVHVGGCDSACRDSNKLLFGLLCNRVSGTTRKIGRTYSGDMSDIFLGLVSFGIVYVALIAVAAMAWRMPIEFQYTREFLPLYILLMQRQTIFQLLTSSLRFPSPFDMEIRSSFWSFGASLAGFVLEWAWASPCGTVLLLLRNLYRLHLYSLRCTALRATSVTTVFMLAHLIDKNDRLTVKRNLFLFWIMCRRWTSC